MISAIVLTENSAAIVERVIKSVAWCDEVIVIDDESIDHTVEIAKKYNAQVHVRPLYDDFAAQRNFGLSKAKGDWVLFVDSDEVVTPELKNEILEKIKADYDGYFLKRRDFLFGRWLQHGETANVKLLRLAKMNAGKWVGKVHEVWRIQGKTGILDNPLLHYPHQTIREFLDEINTYSTIRASELRAKNMRVSGWRIVIYPVAKFIQNYFLRLGFLDKTAGAIVGLMMSFHSFLVRAKLHLLWKKS